MSYDSDISNEAWALIEDLFPAQRPLTGEVKYPLREVVNALLYMEKTGCQWRNLPHDFPPYRSVWKYFDMWKRFGVWTKVQERLHTYVRTKKGSKPNPTTVALDSQSVKTAHGGESIGFDPGKKVRGRKRHIVVDKFSVAMLVLVTSASVQDRDGALVLLQEVRDKYPSVHRVYVDRAYQGPRLRAFSERTSIELKWNGKSSCSRGFEAFPFRWKVEQNFGWKNWSRRLSKDYERTVSSSRTWFQISSVAQLGRWATYANKYG